MTHLDEFREASRHIVFQTEGETESANQKVSDLISEIPDMNPLLHIFDEEAVHTIMKIYRGRWPGTVFDSAEDALERTKKDMLPEIVGDALRFYSFGIEVERSASTTDSYADLAKNNSFWMMATAKAIGLSLDRELVFEVAGYIERVIDSLSREVGFLSPGLPPEMYHKVWDLWRLIVRGVAVPMFLTGRELGKQKRISDTLDGIMNATEGTSDE